jgi:tetratricopeptide (TPR) repeat protein
LIFLSPKELTANLPSPGRRAWVPARYLVAALLLLAAATRVAHLEELRTDPFVDRPIMDAEYHDLWARSILAGQPYFVSPVFFRAPLYPYFLATVYKVFGAGPWGIRAIQMALGLVSLWLVYRIGRRLLGPRAGVIALALAALYDLLPYYEGELLLPTVLILLDLAAFDRLLHAAERRSTGSAVLSGFLFGLSAITRPNVLVVVPALAFWLWRSLKNRAPAVAFALATLPLPLIVTGMNWVRGGDPVFIASQGGVNLYLGNNRASNGWSAVAPGMRADWWGSYEDGIRIPEAEMGRRLRPSEVSSFWTRRALREIATAPGWWCGHLLKKAYLWFAAEELSNNRDLRFWKARLPVIDALPLRYAVLAPLAIAGFFIASRRASIPLALFIVPYALSFVLFFVTSRYRVITVPLLCILAAAVLERTAADAVARRWKPLVRVIALVAVLTAFLSLNLGGVVQPTYAISYMEIGKREMERQAWRDAVSAFQSALAADPGNLDARHDLGVALREGGDPAAGLAELRAVADARNDASSWNNAGLALVMLGRAGEAEDAFRRAIERDPKLGDAWLNAALLAGDRGDYTLALERLARGESLRGADPSIWYHRGRFFEALGRVAEARDAFDRCLALAPGFADASARRDVLARGTASGAPADTAQQDSMRRP